MIEFKEEKRNVLIELIDVLDDPEAVDTLLNQEILAESMVMISKNVYRTFSNKSKCTFLVLYQIICVGNQKTQQVDPDEDEPHLEEAWPHLQLVYELFLKFMMSGQIPGKVMAANISKVFIMQLLELFDSEDPRERDYLKTILHRIYGKFMVLRPYIRTQVMNLILIITYEKEEHNGVTELLEILSSIISGFGTPLKDEHKDFALRVLVPLHKVKGLSSFNTQLEACMKNFIEKDKHIGIKLIQGLLKYWPITCPAKQVVFINEIDEIIELCGPDAEKKFEHFGYKLLNKLVATAQEMHLQAAERSLVLLHNEAITKLVKANMTKAFPIVVKGLINANKGSNKHWNQSVNTLTMTVLRTYNEMNREMFEKIANQNQQSTQQPMSQHIKIQRLQLTQKSKWDVLEKKMRITYSPRNHLITRQTQEEEK